MNEGRVIVTCCPTDVMVADIMTKHVTKLRLQKFASLIFKLEMCKSRVHIQPVFLFLLLSLQQPENKWGCSDLMRSCVSAVVLLCSMLWLAVARECKV